MARNLGPLTAELTEAERAKFTAPLVLVHGLWDDPKSWRRFMGFLSHRGWRCIAVGWRSAEQRTSLAARDAALTAALDQLDDQPVVIGHDLGGLQALRLASRLRASIALAPLVPVSADALAKSGTWLQRLRGGEREAGRSLVAHYPAGRHLEPAAAIEELAALKDVQPAETTTPRLVVAASEDPIAPLHQLRTLATAHDAELETIAGGHAPHLEDGWEAAASTIHRWLIRSLGEELLALYEEAWADREE